MRKARLPAKIARIPKIPGKNQTFMGSTIDYKRPRSFEELKYL